MSENSVANVTGGKMESPTDKVSKIDTAVGNNSVEAKSINATAQYAVNDDTKDANNKEDEGKDGSPSPPASAAMSAATAVAVRKVTLQDLTKFSPGDKTNVKFAVLIGLIEIGQVSNKEVVNTVLQLVRIHFFKVSMAVNFRNDNSIFCSICIKTPTSTTFLEISTCKAVKVILANFYLRLNNNTIVLLSF